MGRLSPIALAMAAFAALAISTAVGLAMLLGRSSKGRPALKPVPAVTYRTSAALAAGPTGQTRRGSLPAFLQAEVELPKQLWSVPTAAAFLRSRGHRVCCEEVFRRAAEAPPTVFPLGSRPQALHHLLDDLTVGDGDYRWDWMENCQIVNVVPKESRLEIALGSFDFENRRLILCVDDLYQPCQLSYGTFRLGNMNDPGRIENWPFSLRARRVTARDYLNLLAAQYDGMTWYVKDGRSVFFEMHPPGEFDRIAERLRSEARQRDRQLQAAAEGAK